MLGLTPLVLPRARQQSSRRPRSGGLTLVEVLVTLSIAGILTAMAAPSFSDFLIRNRSASIANELTSTVMRARSDAVTRNACVIVCRSADPTAATPACNAGTNWQPGWIAFIDETCAGTANSAARPELLVVAAGPLDSRYSLTKATGTNTARLVFSPSGQARAGDAGRFDLRYQTTTRPSNRGICLNAQGRTRVVPFEGAC